LLTAGVGILPDRHLRRGYLDKMDQRRWIDSEGEQHKGERRERRATNHWDGAGIGGRASGSGRADRDDDAEIVEQADNCSGAQSCTARRAIKGGF
jgi:hypothetical protein